LSALPNSAIQGKTGDSLIEAIASGERLAIYFAAAGIFIGALIALLLPRKK